MWVVSRQLGIGDSMVDPEESQMPNVKVELCSFPVGFFVKFCWIYWVFCLEEILLLHFQVGGVATSYSMCFRWQHETQAMCSISCALCGPKPDPKCWLYQVPHSGAMADATGRGYSRMSQVDAEESQQDSEDTESESTNSSSDGGCLWLLVKGVVRRVMDGVCQGVIMLVTLALVVIVLLLCAVILLALVSPPIAISARVLDSSGRWSAARHMCNDESFSGPGCLLKGLGMFSLANATIKNSTAMPALCEHIMAVDAVRNVSQAGSCLEWCHTALGDNVALPYLMCPFDVATVMDPPHWTVYMGCWKAWASAFALRWMPTWRHVYGFAAIYGVFSVLSFLWTWCTQDPVEKRGGPSPNAVTRYGPFQKQLGDFPFCWPRAADGPVSRGFNAAPFCFAVHSDRCGSQVNLVLDLMVLIIEPFLDVVSVLNLLRAGQVYPPFIIFMGVACPALQARDPLQVKGARAGAESLLQGFETSGYMKHKVKEFLEAGVCTLVQIYTLHALHPQAMDVATVFQLMFSVALSCALTLPGGRKAWQVLQDVSEQSWSYARVESAKRTMTWYLKFDLVLGVLFLGWWFASFQRFSSHVSDGISIPWLDVFVGWSELQQVISDQDGWRCICAWLLLLFRVGSVILFLAVALFLPGALLLLYVYWD